MDCRRFRECLHSLAVSGIMQIRIVLICDNPVKQHPDLQSPLAEPLVSGNGQALSLRISSRDLFKQGREVEIEHDGRIYRLRLTQSNKMILTA